MTYKDASLLWHNIWVDDGEPEHGEVYDAMKEAKRQYYYAVRRLTRRERQYRYEKMAQAAASDKSRHFWQEVKKMRDCKIKPPNIDGKYSNKDIAELFS